jgi:hypothetical protein
MGILRQEVSARRFPAQIRLTLDSEIPKHSAIVKSAAQRCPVLSELADLRYLGIGQLILSAPDNWRVSNRRVVVKKLFKGFGCKPAR